MSALFITLGFRKYVKKIRYIIMKIKVEIPTSLADIKLSQYKKYLNIQLNNDDERFLQAKMIEIFCNIPLKDVMKLKYNDTNEISSILTNMFEQKPKLVERFKLNGVEYGFHPVLDDMSLGEYIDLDTYIGDWENIERAMNVLYRPIENTFKNKYSIKEYEVEGYKDVLDMPMDAALSSIFFLWNLGLDDRVSNFGNKWGWYQSIYGLAQGDITRFQNITKLNMHECFMMLSFMKDKNELEAEQIKSKMK